jgi:phosphoesterase RecJ-like protein
VDPGRVKVSLRSTGRVNIDSVCARLGGGGHPHAAGVMLRGTREQARARVLPDLERLLAELPAPGGAPMRSIGRAAPARGAGA